MVTVLACWRLSSVSMSGAVSVGKAAGRRGRGRPKEWQHRHRAYGSRTGSAAEQPHGIIQDGAYSDLHHNASHRRETRRRRAYLMEMRAQRRGREGAPTGRLEGHRTGKIGRDVLVSRVHFAAIGKPGGKGWCRAASNNHFAHGTACDGGATSVVGTDSKGAGRQGAARAGEVRARRIQVRGR